MEKYNLNNFYETKIKNPYERAFVIMLTKYIIFNALPEISPSIWQDAEIEVRMQDGRIPTDGDSERKINGGLALAAYSVRYIAENLKKPEIVSILSRSLASLPKEPLATFETFGKRFDREHIFDVFFAQPRKRISNFDLKTFPELFKYPCWLEFSKDAKKQIHTAILAGKLSDQATDYYLGVSEEHEDYAELLPVIKHIIKNTKDPHLFWTAGDVLNLIWLNLPDDDAIQKKFRKEIYDMFWPRIGSSWPIINYDSVRIEDPDARQIFKDSYGWLTSLSDLGELNPDLKDIPTRTQESNKHLSLKKFLQRLIHPDGPLDLDDNRIQEILDNFDEVIEIYSAEEAPLLNTLTRAYGELCGRAASLTDISPLENLGAKIIKLATGYDLGPEATHRYVEKIDKLTSHAKSTVASYRREQRKLEDLINNK